MTWVKFVKTKPGLLSFRSNMKAIHSTLFHTSATTTASISSANLAVANWAVTRTSRKNWKGTSAGTNMQQKKRRRREHG